MSDLSEYAQNPKTVTVDGVTVTRHSPTELIEAERYQQQCKAEVEERQRKVKLEQIRASTLSRGIALSRGVQYSHPDR